MRSGRRGLSNIEHQHRGVQEQSSVSSPLWLANIPRQFCWVFAPELGLCKVYMLTRFPLKRKLPIKENPRLVISEIEKDQKVLTEILKLVKLGAV